jgi:hypothetical protein
VSGVQEWVKIGQRVQVVFEELPDGQALPQFSPVE